MRLSVLTYVASLVLVTLVASAPVDVTYNHSVSDPARNDPLTLSHDTPPLTALEKRGRNGKATKGQAGKKTPSKSTTNGSQRTSARLSANRQSKLAALSLIDALQSFDMVTDVRMEDPPASGTNTISGAVMEGIMNDLAGLPASSQAKVKLPKLTMTRGTFQPTIKSSWLTVTSDSPRLKNAIALMEASKATKAQFSARTISGEADLTQVITHALAFPATEILAAVLPSSASDSHPYWHGVGRGSAPIPDLRLQHGSKTLAVIEIKTTHSLTDEEVDEVMSRFSGYKMGWLEEDSESDSAGRMPALLDPKAKAPTHRGVRKHGVRVTEQLLAQMWSTGASIGAITNLKRWLIVERTGNSAFKLTDVPATLNNGHSNALNIMLAMSFQALGKK